MEATFPQWIMNLLYAPRCLFCDCRMEPEKGFWVCDECRENMPALADVSCSKCGSNIEYTWKNFTKCKPCGQKRTNYLLPIKYFNYADARVENCLKKFKFLSAVDKAKPMAEIMVANMMRLDKLPEFDYIVPMPMATGRYKQRGFNQCELIAKEMSKLLKIEYNNKTFRKKKETLPQSTISEWKRSKNLEDAFGIYDERFLDKNILLVDDVSTTGASINEAVKTMLENGDAKSVKAVVFAHT